MTKLNYSDLPLEAQQAIQKLTGSTDEELTSEKPKSTTPKPSKAREKPFSKPVRQQKKEDALAIQALAVLAAMALSAIYFLCC